jgi:hypothetical protein
MIEAADSDDEDDPVKTPPSLGSGRVELVAPVGESSEGGVPDSVSRPGVADEVSEDSEDTPPVLVSTALPDEAEEVPRLDAVSAEVDETWESDFRDVSVSVGSTYVDMPEVENE